MKNLIERYVYDIVRRLPEKERDEVSKELKSNIYDMLPDNADENEIKAVLYELGAPASLAEKYRQKPRYLISPAFYDDYVHALKWILPMVGGLALTVGMILGAIDAMKDGMFNLVSNILSKGISLGLSGVFQALIWTTAGFVIAERTSGKANEGKERGWNIEDLPEALPNDKSRIPLSDSIIELILTIVFSTVIILLCTGIVPIAFMLQDGGTQICTFFSSEFLAICIPAVAVIAFFGIGECIFKMKERRWTPLVCGVVIASNVISMCIMIYLINRPDLFSAEFMTFLQGIDWGSYGLQEAAGMDGISLSIIIISITIAVCNLAECCRAVYNTIQNKKSS